MDCAFLLLDYQFHWALASDLYTYIFIYMDIYTYILCMYLRIYVKTCRVSDLNTTSQGEVDYGTMKPVASSKGMKFELCPRCVSWGTLGD
jgi:hypothetical protein